MSRYPIQITNFLWRFRYPIVPSRVVHDASFHASLSQNGSGAAGSALGIPEQQAKKKLAALIYLVVSKIFNFDPTYFSNGWKPPTN